MSNTVRRTFRKILTAGIVGSFADIAALGQDVRSPVQPEFFLLDANGWVPNNPVFPILLYRGVICLTVDHPLRRRLLGRRRS